MVPGLDGSTLAPPVLTGTSIVERRISTALILEDDADWDVRIKDQLVAFAEGTRSLYRTNPGVKTHSPYGDGWDLLWLGKCNDGWVEEKQASRELYIIDGDFTVPLLKNMRDEDGRTMLKQAGLGDHTRVVHRVENPYCTFAYAVSYAGARKILYSLSVAGLAWTYDLSMNWWCTDPKRKYAQECIGITPTLFHQHRVKTTSASKNSDNFEGQGITEEAYTHSVRWSVKKNIEKLVQGRSDFVDSYPDNGDPSRV